MTSTSDVSLLREPLNDVEEMLAYGGTVRPLAVTDQIPENN